MASTPDATFTRDSKNPTGPTLRFAQASWTGFVAQAQIGRFDH